MKNVRLLRLLLLAFLYAATDVSAQVVTEMTDERIREAIAAGEASRNDKAGFYPLQPKSGWGNGPVVGFFTTPFSRVVEAAYEAKKKYKALTPADVTPMMIAPEIHVYTFSRPAVPRRGTSQIANVEAVVIMPAGSDDRNRAIHPTTTRDTAERYSNMFGASSEGRSMIALFPLTVLSEQNEIHVVFDRHVAGEGARTCKDCAVRFKLKDIR